MKQREPEIFLMVADSAWVMKPSTTISQLNKGWDIQGINIGRKIVRYLWGKQARQQVEGRRPTFLVRPSEPLNDYALIALRVKRSYRRLPSASLIDCPYKRIEPTDFEIKPVGDLDFLVKPIMPLEPGEYMIVALSQKPVNEYGDVTVYDFSVR